MATFNKVNAFVEHLAEGVHNLASHTLKIMLTNTAPVAANSVKADLTEIAAGNGYTAGGPTVTVTDSSQTGGTYKLTISDVTITASGGSIPASGGTGFRYFVLYNDTPTSPADPILGYWDYGSSITLANGESVTADFSSTSGAIQIS